jgi:hypothetical protein
VGGKWYCSYLELRECYDLAMLPVDEVRIDSVEMNDIGLGKSIYTKKQLDEFTASQDIQGMRKAYLTETAEMANMGWNEKGEWGLAQDQDRRRQKSPTWRGSRRSTRGG